MTLSELSFDRNHISPLRSKLDSFLAIVVPSVFRARGRPRQRSTGQQRRPVDNVAGCACPARQVLPRGAGGVWDRLLAVMESDNSRTGACGTAAESHRYFRRYLSLFELCYPR